jgi:hypothetical protein
MDAICGGNAIRTEQGALTDAEKETIKAQLVPQGYHTDVQDDQRCYVMGRKKSLIHYFAKSLGGRYEVWLWPLTPPSRGWYLSGSCATLGEAIVHFREADV